MKKYFLACLLLFLLNQTAYTSEPAEELTEEEVYDAMNEAWKNCRRGCTFSNLPFNLRKHIYKEILLPNVTTGYSYIVTKRNLGNGRHNSFLIVMSKKDGTPVHGYVSAITPNANKASKTLIEYKFKKGNIEPSNNKKIPATSNIAIPNSVVTEPLNTDSKQPSSTKNKEKSYSTALVPYVDTSKQKEAVIYNGTTPVNRTSPNPNASKEVAIYESPAPQSPAKKTKAQAATSTAYPTEAGKQIPPGLTQPNNPNDKALVVYGEKTQSGTTPANQFSQNPSASKEVAIYDPSTQQSPAKKPRKKAAPEPKITPEPAPTPHTNDTSSTVSAKIDTPLPIHKKSYPAKPLPLANALSHPNTAISKFMNKRQNSRLSVYEEDSIVSSVNSANTAISE